MIRDQTQNDLVYIFCIQIIIILEGEGMQSIPFIFRDNGRLFRFVLALCATLS